MHQHKSACKIQQHARGYLTRKGLYGGPIDHEKLYRGIVDDIIDGFLRGEFIPDVLIDVFTRSGHEYDPVSPEEQIAYEQVESLMRTVVNGQVQEVVRACVKEFTDDFLRYWRSSRRGEDPVVAVVAQLVEDVTGKMSVQAVQDALKEMVNEFLFQQQFDSILVGLLQPQIASVARETLHDMKVDEYAGGLVEETVLDLARGVVHEAIEAEQDVLLARRKRSEFTEVCQLLERASQQRVLDKLIRTVASDAEDVLFREQMDFSLALQAAQALLDRTLGDYAAQRAISSNLAERYAFQAVTARLLREELPGRFESELDALERELDEAEGGLEAPTMAE